MKFVFFVLLVVIPFSADAIVSSPAAVSEGEWSVEYGYVLEEGKVEPHENRESFHPARIEIHGMGVTRGLSGPGFGTDHFLRLDYRNFASGREEAAGTVFYGADSGRAATLTYGFSFVHEAGYSAGVSASVTPWLEMNKEKFSQPRIDEWGLDLVSSLEVSPRWFWTMSLHYGSGLRGFQNSYLAMTPLFGFRAGAPAGLPLLLKAGPYAELDLEERRDERYDAVFSAPGESSRIRSMKVGTLARVDLALPGGFYLGAGVVQKLGGYDAPATRALTFSLGGKF